jgi:16S rRNA (cytosine1402-N4)-methyltransferase
VEIPECRCGHQAQIKIINRKVIVSGAEEIKNNPASRSAKLRIVEKI